MHPLLQLVLSVSFMVGLAVLLFGAPFVPPFRPIAVNVLVILTALGNIFVFFVIGFTLYTYYQSKKDEPPEAEESEEEGEAYKKKTASNSNPKKSKSS